MTFMLVTHTDIYPEQRQTDGTVFDRHVQAVEPPSWYIMSPPFTPAGDSYARAYTMASVSSPPTLLPHLRL